MELEPSPEIAGSTNLGPRIELHCHVDAQYESRIRSVHLRENSANYSAIRKRWSELAVTQSPHLERIIAFDATEDRLVLTSQLPIGELLTLVPLQPASNVYVAVKTVRDIVEGLNNLHAIQLLHGQICPNHIWLAADGCAALLHSSNIGTNGEDSSLSDIQFFAPEQCGSLDREPSCATDLYSCGVLLFRLLAGFFPIEANEVGDFLLKQLTTEPARLRMHGIRIPVAIDEMVARLLKREPKDRYQTAASLLHDLDRILAGLQSTPVRCDFAIGRTDHRRNTVEPAYVGRSHEIVSAVRMVEAAFEGNGSFLAARSGMGGGKTRWLAEVEHEATSLGANVLVGRAFEAERARPLQALEGIVSGVVRMAAEDKDFHHRLESALKPHSESLKVHFPELPLATTLSTHDKGPEAFAARRLVTALEVLLEFLAQQNEAIVILIDDLDHADEVTLQVFQRWNQRATEGVSRLAIICTIDADRESILRTWQNLERVHLAQLDDASINALLESMAGQLPDQVLQLVCQLSEGNPFMAAAVLCGLIEAKNIVPGNFGWEIRSLSIDDLRSDDQAAKLLALRIDKLSSDSIEALTVAALLGRCFNLGEASRLAIKSPEAFSRVIEPAITGHLLWQDVGSSNCGFVHEHVRSALLNRLTLDMRKNLHRRAARLIESADPSRCFELAYHYDAAEQGKKALHYSMLAARSARQQYSHELTLRHYEIAKNWTTEDQRPLNLEISEGSGDVHLDTGNYDQAESCFSQALGYTSSVLEDMRIRAKIGELEFKRGRMPSAAEQFEGALNKSGIYSPKSTPQMLLRLTWEVIVQAQHTLIGYREDRPIASELDRIRWRLQSRLSHTFWFSRGKLWTLMNHLRTLNSTERFAPTAELAKLYSEHAPVMSLLRFFSRADQYSQRSLLIRKAQHDIWGQGQTLHYSGVVHLAACRFENCMKACTEAITLLERTGDAWETNMARYQLANALYRVGRHREAVEEALKMHRLGLEIGDDQASGISLDVILRADPQAIPADVVEAQAAIVRGDAQSHAQTHLALAILRIEQGKLTDATDILEKAIDRCVRAGHLNTYISPCYSWLAKAQRMKAERIPRSDECRFRQQIAIANRCAHKAYRVAKLFPADLPHAMRELGNIALLKGTVSQALAWFRDSFEQARRLGCKSEELRGLEIYLQYAKPLVHKTAPTIALLEERRADLHSLVVDRLSVQRHKGTPAANLSLSNRFLSVLKDGREIVRSLTPEVVYFHGCQSAKRLLRGQVARVISVQQVNEQVTIGNVLASDAEGGSTVIDNKLCHSLIREALYEQNAITRPWKMGRSTSQGSLLAVPIVARDQVVACMILTHSDLSDLFGAEERRIAEFIGALIGASLENSDGFARLRELNETLEQRVADRTAAAEQRARELDYSNRALRMTEEQLRHAIDEANAANAAKSRFLATMSHEIRTPLNGILGMTELTLATDLDDTQQNYLHTIHRSGDCLLQLLNDLLDFSKIEAGKMTVESIAMESREVLSDVLQLMAVPAFQKGIELIGSFANDLPKWLMGDPARIRQIALNLVGNAIKFTRHGHVELRADVVNSHDGKRLWRLTVSDTGIGIPHDKMKSIFEAFTQADNSTTRKFGGTGLGLAITSELAALMMGNVHLESEVGKGSQFCVTLPLDEVSAESIANLPQLSLAGRRILVVEPCEVARRAIEEMLIHWRADVISIAKWNDTEEIDRPPMEIFDCAIFAGHEAMQLAKTAHSLAVPYCVADHPGSSVNRFDMRILSKPIVPKTLVIELERMLADRSSKDNSSVQSLLPTCVWQARRNLRILIAEDGFINQQVLVGLLELHGHSATVTNDGSEALEMSANQEFDVCLMDLDMPEMDGLTATKAIRERETKSNSGRLPIYAMTAHHDGGYAELCQLAGMNGYLTKPVDPDTLFALLDKIIPANPSIGAVTSPLDSKKS